MSLHHVVADGNVKTGLRVSSDDSAQGHLIAREAAPRGSNLGGEGFDGSALCEEV